MSDEKKEVPVIEGNTKWRHRKTKRPILVERTNRMKPEVVFGRLFTGVSSTIYYHYTDRTTRVMPQSMNVHKFLKTFEAST